MAISQVGSTTNGSTASANSLVVSKPTGTANGNVLIALVTSNDGTITATGWTAFLTQTATATGDLFTATWLYKVASSEGSSWTFSNGSGSAPPMVASVMAFTGVDTSSSPIGGSTSASAGALSEPVTSGACTSSGTSLAFYSRSVRVAGDSSPGHPFTFTASGVTELDDIGQWSGGTVSYSQGIYCATADASGSPSAINITGSSTKAATDNLTASFTLKTLFTSVSPAPGKASATATAYAPTVQTGIAVSPGRAAAAAAAQQPSAGHTAVAGLATATAAVRDVGRRVATGVAAAVATGDRAQSFLGTPGYRTYHLPADSRTLHPLVESRTYQVPSDSGHRTIAVGWDDQ